MPSPSSLPLLKVRCVNIPAGTLTFACCVFGNTAIPCWHLQYLTVPGHPVQDLLSTAVRTLLSAAWTLLMSLPVPSSLISLYLPAVLFTVHASPVNNLHVPRAFYCVCRLYRCLGSAYRAVSLPISPHWPRHLSLLLMHASHVSHPGGCVPYSSAAWWIGLVGLCPRTLPEFAQAGLNFLWVFRQPYGTCCTVRMTSCLLLPAQSM
jgi:hypothetical protein